MIASDEMMQSTAAAYSPYLYHWVESCPQENIVKLEDGSEWMFDFGDIAMMRSWRPGDTMVISPVEPGWFTSSNYSYMLTNRDLGQTIYVNPVQGPVLFGSYSNWIGGLDPHRGHAYIHNGQGERTIWEIHSWDAYLFDDWAVNDHVIFAQNNSWSWWFSSYDHIIINVPMNHYVRARQYSSLPTEIKETRKKRTDVRIGG